jgi:uncharacterized protein with NAD-binding domain and iron-sulfur cluster
MAASPSFRRCELIAARGTGQIPIMRVAVFGGGIAGLTAAHELSDRGLEVAVYEPTSPLEAMGPWTAIGGKARSQYFRLTETGDTYLPGEHGFRFLPTFYRNVFDILDRIP